MVYFSPGTALEALKDKPRGWFRDTCGGDAPILDRKFSRNRKRRRNESEESNGYKITKPSTEEGNSGPETSNSDGGEEVSDDEDAKKAEGSNYNVKRAKRYREQVILSESEGTINLSGDSE